MPGWLAEICRLEDMLPVTVRRTDEHGNVRAFSNNKIELTAKVVCESCNTGWMSDLETDVKSALLPLVVGSPTVVSLDEQRLLAAWAQKTAMTLEHTFSSPPESIYYSAEESGRTFERRARSQTERRFS